ncbi:hypothetical protein ACEUZ9_000531 [Paracoccus litorisediminis]|uniref:Threonine/homoserine/homoserine lactone efflux protein n=1 Tax=Paracoccus litorisediminis TaxID=2006130 RepID=A0A844HK09_9RHOB|nr:hypothetical protein [Paracoccus litorisediminis]MTH59338.1 hypothetical protein [Paracoccus litorisediminis]
MAITAFVFGVLALLLAPGPTNTLMGLAGAQGGLSRVVRLLPAELAGYVTTILPLSFLSAQLFQSFPGFGVALKIIAAIWIALLAIRLWTSLSLGKGEREISATRVYITTCLNPKALIFGLVLLPSPQSAEFVPRFALFGAMVIGVAMIWGGLGVVTQLSAAGTKRLAILQRVASAWLLFVSLSLMFNIVRT